MSDNWPSRCSPFDGDQRDVDRTWDMTCRASGGGFDMLVTLGDIRNRPNQLAQDAFKLRCIEQFPTFFAGARCETAAVTVGPHRPESDTDQAVG